MRKQSYFLCAIFSIFGLFAQAATLLVPNNYSTIQDAVDASGNGDQIVITENCYNNPFVIDGKQLFITSDLKGNKPVISMTGNVVNIINNSEVEIQDLRILSYAEWNVKNAIECQSSSLRLKDAIINGLNYSGGENINGMKANDCIIIEILNSEISGSRGNSTNIAPPGYGARLVNIDSVIISNSNICGGDGGEDGMGGGGGLTCDAIAELIIIRSIIEGGRGGDAYEHIYGYVDPGGTGGNGLLVYNSTHIKAAESEFIGGEGGHGNPDGADGKPLIILDDSTYEEIPWPTPTPEIPTSISIDAWYLVE